MSFNRNLSFLAQGVSSSGILNASYGGSLAWQSVQTGNFTAVAGNAYPVNTTSGAVTVTLPASPTTGQAVQFTDYAGTWATNNVTISRNGSNINGSAANFIAAGLRETIAFVYIDATQGWIAYSGINASPFTAYTISYLVVAGGGGGGKSRGGGGGAGGLLSGTLSFSPGTVYPVVIGAGGAGGTATSATAPNGSTSYFQTSVVSNVATIGGGGGAGAPSSLINGASGGSGGGASGNPASPGAGGSGGSGTSGQGFAGGKTYSDNSTYTSGGGGGGASAAGVDAAAKKCGNGGAGTASSITGASVTYAGGGGGGGDGSVSGNVLGTGGAGGGGNGSVTSNGGAATANTGGGGGGCAQTTYTGGNGGSGVVILSVPTINYTGITTGSPTITTSGSDTIIKFTASGSYTA